MIVRIVLCCMLRLHELNAKMLPKTIEMMLLLLLLKDHERDANERFDIEPPSPQLPQASCEMRVCGGVALCRLANGAIIESKSLLASSWARLRQLASNLKNNNLADKLQCSEQTLASEQACRLRLVWTRWAGDLCGEECSSSGNTLLASWCARAPKSNTSPLLSIIQTSSVQEVAS